MKNLILTLICGIFLLGVLPTHGEANVIVNGSKVAFEYTLTVEGEIVDSSKGQKPLEYTHGEKMIIPGLERELEGLKANDSKKVVIAPEDAYGVRDNTRVVEVPKSNLQPGVEPKVGMVLQLQTDQGQPLSGVISQVNDNSVMIDFNHPLAGKELHFEVTIISIN